MPPCATNNGKCKNSGGFGLISILATLEARRSRTAASGGVSAGRNREISKQAPLAKQHKCTYPDKQAPTNTLITSIGG